MLGWEDGNPRRLVTGTGGKSYGSALGRLHGREPLEMKPADDGCMKVTRSQETKWWPPETLSEKGLGKLCEQRVKPGVETGRGHRAENLSRGG